MSEIYNAFELINFDRGMMLMQDVGVYIFDHYKKMAKESPR